MLDLDEQESSSAIVRLLQAGAEAGMKQRHGASFLLSLLLLQKITVQQHDQLAKWLGSRYILPAQRSLHPAFITEAAQFATNSTEVIQLALSVSIAETHYLLSEQAEALELLKVSKKGD